MILKNPLEIKLLSLFVIPILYGINKVNKQIINPIIMLYMAPKREPLLQNNAPKNAGANCAIITNAIIPIETKL